MPRQYTPLDGDELVDPSYLGTGTPDGTKFLRDDQTYQTVTGGSGAPTTVDYLVGTADAGLSAEIVVGTTPGGELGGTWASPTVDATHSGSAHHLANSVRKNSTGSTFTRTRLNLIEGSNVTLTVADDAGNDEVDVTIAASGTGAPDTADYLVGTAQGGLSAEIVVGTTPGGELGGTWASPTVDATHSGSAHHVEDHDHDGSPTQQLVQANTHQSADTDSGTSSLHHTIGTGSTQAAAGSHTHAGSSVSIVYKSGDEIVNNSSVIQDDNHLIFALAATGEYEFELNGWFESATTPNFKYDFSVPASTTIYVSETGLDSASASHNDAFTTVGVAGTLRTQKGQGATTVRHFRLKGYVRTTGTSGNLTFRWAQNTQNVSDTTLLRGSSLKVYQLA